MRLEKAVVYKLSCRGGQEWAAVGAFKGRMRPEKIDGHLLIFFRFQRAGCIDEGPASDQEVRCDVQQLSLYLRISGNIGCRLVPPDFRVASYYAGPGAGGIDQDAVKTMVCQKRKIEQGPMVNGYRQLRVETRQIFPQQQQASRRWFDRGNGCIKAGRKLDDVAGLAAKTRAAVEEMSVLREGCKQKTDKLCRLVLHLESPSVVPGQFLYRTVILRQDNGIRSMGARSGGDAVLSEQGTEVVSGRYQAVYPQDEGRTPVVAVTDPEHLLPAEVSVPAFRQPNGMIQDRCSVEIGAADGGQTMPLPETCSQHPIDKTLQLYRQVDDMHCLDRFVDRGGFGYPVKKEQLIEADCEGMMDKGMKLCQRTPTEDGKAAIEVLTLTQHSVDQVHGQTTVRSGQRTFLADFLEEKVHRQRRTLQPA